MNNSRIIMIIILTAVILMAPHPRNPFAAGQEIPPTDPPVPPLPPPLSPPSPPPPETHGGCYNQTWLSPSSQIFAAILNQTLASCELLCMRDSSCIFMTFNQADGTCSLNGEPDILSGNAPNASVSQMCFPRGNGKVIKVG